MKDFVYDAGVKIFYGVNQQTPVAEAIRKLGERLLLVPTGSFLRPHALPQYAGDPGISGGHHRGLHCRKPGVTGYCLFPLLAV